MSPSLRLTTSPGTRSLASSERKTLPRLTDALGASDRFSASIASPADFSSKYPTTPLTICSVISTAKSSQSSSNATTVVASQIMTGIGPQKKLRNTSTSFRFTSSSRFSPNRSSRAAASASLSPSGGVAMAYAMSASCCSSRLRVASSSPSRGLPSFFVGIAYAKGARKKGDESET